MNQTDDTLSATRAWLGCIERDEIDDPTYRSLRRAIRAYCADLEHRATLAQPYTDDIHRRHELCELMHGLDPAFDFAAELSGDQSTVPDEIVPMYIGAVIHAIEAQYPTWAEVFANERKMYSEWLEGKGPFAGEPWCADV
jgi:hypothetical protein